jgi:hypothetical protein
MGVLVDYVAAMEISFGLSRNGSDHLIGWSMTAVPGVKLSERGRGDIA